MHCPLNYSFCFKIRSINKLTQADLFETNLISDFMLEKDTIFAGITLSELEMSLYRKICNQSSQTCSGSCNISAGGADDAN